MSDKIPSQSLNIVEEKTGIFGFKKWKESLFLGSVAGMSILFGFGLAVSKSKKQDPKYFDKGLVPSAAAAAKMESGASFALRALGYGTLFAVTGCGILFYSIWKMMGVQNLEEFRQKAGNILPRIPKNDPPQSRTEFSSLTDFLQYLIDEDAKNKSKKSTKDSPKIE